MPTGVNGIVNICCTRTAGQNPHINNEIETARRRMLKINLNLRMYLLYTICNRYGMIAAYPSERRGHDVKHF
jgi:hypothetical protein